MVRDLANGNMFAEFGKLWFGVPRYHAVTCISYLLMHFCYNINIKITKCDYCLQYFAVLVIICVIYLLLSTARLQVVRIFDMFYQPWVRVFVDVRGAQYDVMKPKFTDSRRLFRFA